MEKRIIIISNNLLGEKTDFTKELQNVFDIKEFKEEEIDNSIKYMKELKFHDTFILLSDTIKNKFIENLKLNLEELKIIPKIFTLTNSHSNFILLRTFYNYGEGNLDQIKKYLLELMKEREKKKKETKEEMSKRDKEKFESEKGIPNEENIIRNKKEYNFEFDNIEQLTNIYESLKEKDKKDNIPDKDINDFNEWLHQEYLENFIFDENDITFQLSETYDIPNELLSKYYINMYSMGGKFDKSMKKDLLLTGPLKSKFNKYIKILYKANYSYSNKFKNISNIKLYHSLNIEDYEIEKIIEKQQSKVYARRFLSFSYVKDVVEKHKIKNNYNTLITLDYNRKINLLLPTYSIIENISALKEEKEVLFFPFSLFKIISINTKQNEYNKEEYEITLQLDTINENPKIKGKNQYENKKDIKKRGNSRRDEFKTKKLLYLIIMSILVLFIGICIYFYKNKTSF